jgi:soluble lytic murein transglycosylase-like protein
MRALIVTSALMLVTVAARAEPAVITPDTPGMGDLITGLPPAAGAGRDLYVKQVMAEAARQNVPPALADAVAVVESGYNPDARGSSGEVGLMQIMPGTAAMLGFTGTTGELFEPATNIHYAVAYLARAWAASGGNVCRALMKYRAGTGEEGFSPLSIQYCQHAHTWLASINSPLAAGLAATTPLVPTIADPYQVAMGGHVIHRVDFSQIGALADMPDLSVQPMRATQAGKFVQHIRAAAPEHTGRAQAAVDAALSD